MGTQRGTPISADADTAKQFEAFLTSKAAQWRKSNAPNSSEQAKMWEDLERAWSTSFRRQLPSSARVGMRDLDQSYAPYKTVERAAEAVGNDFGDFTPAQLMNAVKSRTPGPKFAREGGILQPEAQDMRSVFKDNIPNSGTADRASLMALASGLWFDPVSTAATVGTAVPLMTTKAGRNLMTGDSPVNAALRAVRLNKVLREGAPLAGISFADRSTGNYSEDPNAP
jgi:hypothetical protein